MKNKPEQKMWKPEEMMMKKNKILAAALLASVLISGCAGINSPSGTEREKIITTADMTETSSRETSVSTDTAAETTAEPEKTAVTASITPTGIQKDGRKLCSNVMNGIEQIYMMPYDSAYSSEEIWDYYFSPNGRKWQPGAEMMTEHVDITGAPDYPTEESYMKWHEDDDGNIPVLTHRGASFYMVRESSGIFTLDTGKNIENRIRAMPMTEYRDFRSQYEIWWSDVTATVGKPADDEREFGDLTDIRLGYTLFDTVTVNAFICRADEDRLAILIDTSYMQGIPLFSDNCNRFQFGDTVVISDSVLVYSYIDNAYGYMPELDKIPENGYAYAKVTLFQQNICWDHNNGYESGYNVGELTKLQVLDTFTDIKDFVYPGDAPMIDTVKENAQMSLYYGALDRAYTDIYTENTVGVKLVDLDLDNTPEVIVSRLNKTGDVWWEWGIDADIYRFTDTSLKRIGTLPLTIATSDSCAGYYIGKCVLPDGGEGWFASFRKSPSSDENWGEGDYMFSISKDNIYYIPCFTAKTSGHDNEYYFMGTAIKPISEDKGNEYPVLTWNGITAEWGGMPMLYGTAREAFCSEMIPASICLADGLYSNILTENGKDTEVFVLDVTDFRSAAAKEVYNWCTCGNAEKEHKWFFLR